MHKYYSGFEPEALEALPRGGRGGNPDWETGCAWDGYMSTQGASKGMCRLRNNSQAYFYERTPILGYESKMAISPVYFVLASNKFLKETFKEKRMSSFRKPKQFLKEKYDYE
jgi:hypothetical protein